MSFPHCWHSIPGFYNEKADQCCWCGITRRQIYVSAELPLHGDYLRLPEWRYSREESSNYFSGTYVVYGDPIIIEPECTERPISPDAPMLGGKDR